MFEYVHFKYFSYDIVLLFLLIATIKESAGAPQLGTPANDFTRHSVVQPIVQHGRSKREITSTRDTAGEHHKQVSVTVNVDGEEYVLDLALNEHLVSKDHVISFQENGQTVLRRPTKEELDICQYSGTVRGKPSSWVAVSTCRGISGVIHDGHSLKYIEPAGEKGVNGDHFLYDHADLKTTHATHKEDKNNAPENKGTSPLLLKKHPSEQILERASSRFKREAAEEEAFNFEKRSVQMMFVADSSLFKDVGSSNVYFYIMAITNIVNSMYAPLNIHILVEVLKVWNELDEIHIDTNASITLHNFAEYRKTNLLPKFINNDFAQLLTLKEFDDGVGGMSFIGGICSEDMAVGIGRRVSSVIGPVAFIVANEFGHNLGMNHNNESCDCQGYHCIMHPSAAPGRIKQTQWSDCNKMDLAAAYLEGKDYCLHDPEPSNWPLQDGSMFSSTKTGSQCGDGWVDIDESCDCGNAFNPTCDDCCDIRTCKKKIWSFSCIWRGVKEYLEDNNYGSDTSIDAFGKR